MHKRRRRDRLQAGHVIVALELWRGQEILARLEYIGDDFPQSPWMYANIFPSTAFESVRDLFREVPDDEDGKIHRQRLCDRQILLFFGEPYVDPVREFTMFVEGGRARFKIDEDLEKKVSSRHSAERKHNPVGGEEERA